DSAAPVARENADPGDTARRELATGHSELERQGCGRADRNGALVGHEEAIARHRLLVPVEVFFLLLLAEGGLDSPHRLAQLVLRRTPDLYGHVRTLRNAFEGRVVEHQPAFASVSEANGDDATSLDLRHDALAECAVTNRVARGERRNVLTRCDTLRAVGRPGCRPQPLAFDRAPQLVEKARWQVVASRA